MKVRNLPLALLAILQVMTVAWSQETPEQSRSAYTIQPGDILEISVWKEPDLQKLVLVAPDGGLSFPLAGELSARDKSVKDIREEITELLAQYIAQPVVTVTVSEVLGNKIYVLGQVKNPGQFVVNPQVDVMQALSMAGGATPFASLNEIVILRRSRGRQTAIPFSYNSVATGRDLSQNIVLESGDIVVVP